MIYIKPFKILTFICAVCVCAYYLTVLNAYTLKELHIYKRKLAAQTIEEDLREKDLKIDIKSKSTKPLEKLTPDELRKALWIMAVQNDQLRYSLDTVRSAIEYHEGE